MSASGSLLPPLPYKPSDKTKLNIDIEDTASRKNPATDEIEHCMIFGMPGVDEAVYTYRGNLDSCTEVLNLLHSGKFKVGYKALRPKSTRGESQTSLELLFASQPSLDLIPET